ncbi:uncharacterized protein LOC117340685 [Pecten maximus]|uniref:uncharacterized protein LOC117340685 n=1 Tax=Pecten maximus TaxID=6579 RepID=UPI001458C3AB|nr:uncharacterized protein LOC117340685 [Pecten maximus]
MVGYMRCNVSPYIPNPLRCRNCQRYGHHEDRCRRREVCEHCGREGHNDTDSCDITGKRCPNCKGNHAASSRDCLSWKKEREVLRVKYTRNISFPDARRVVESNDPAALSYAFVTKSKTQQNTITVSDAKVQAYFDKPVFGAEVPPLMDERNDNILFGLASRFKSGRVASKTTSTSVRPSKPDETAVIKTNMPAPPAHTPVRHVTQTSKPRVTHHRRTVSQPSDLNKIAGNTNKRPATTPPQDQQKPKVKLHRLPSLNNTKPSKGSNDPIHGHNRYDVLADDSEFGNSNAAVTRQPTPSSPVSPKSVHHEPG